MRAKFGDDPLGSPISGKSRGTFLVSCLQLNQIIQIIFKLSSYYIVIFPNSIFCLKKLLAPTKYTLTKLPIVIFA